MSEFNITIEGGTSKRLPTAGKYVDRDIIVTAKGGDTMVGTWIFNAVLDITLPDGIYPINISAKVWGGAYEIVGLTFYDGLVMGLVTDLETGNYLDCYEDGDWLAPRIYDITEEPTNAELIAWIKANGRKATYEDGFAEGEKAILSTYVDWAVSTTSNSCIVEFYNDCDFYAHIRLDVNENKTGEHYTEEFVLAPRDEYYISEGEMGMQDMLEAEWTVSVTISKFSTDGEE